MNRVLPLFPVVALAAAIAVAAAPAFAANPTSNQASNLLPRDTSSPIAPALPAPDVGAANGPAGYLRAAQQSLASRQTGKAQQALEMAETRLLDRSVPQGTVGDPDRGAPIRAIRVALRDLGRNDLAAAQQHTGDALRAIQGQRRQ